MATAWLAAPAALARTPHRTTVEPWRRFRPTNTAAATRMTPASSRLTTASGITPEATWSPCNRVAANDATTTTGATAKPRTLVAVARPRPSNSLRRTPQVSGVASRTTRPVSGMQASLHPQCHQAKSLVDIGDLHAGDRGTFRPVGVPNPPEGAPHLQTPRPAAPQETGHDCFDPAVAEHPRVRRRPPRRRTRPSAGNDRRARA